MTAEHPVPASASMEGNHPMPSAETPAPPGGCPAGHGRRAFVRSALGAGAAGAVLAGGGFALSQADAPRAQAADTTNAAKVPFHGAHQAGILTPTPTAATFVSFDVIAPSRAELAGLFRTITERARFLTAGGTPADLGVGAPALRQRHPRPDRPRRRAHRHRRRRRLPLRRTLRPSQGQAGPPHADEDLPQRQPRLRRVPRDLSLQICGNRQDTVLHALRDIAKHTRGAMQIKWRIDGFQNTPRPTGAPRNLLGFKDGIANPVVTSTRETSRVIWVGDGQGEPAWARGGSYQVIRIIRMLVEFWDRVSLSEQELMFGRRKDTGAPLDGAEETDIPQYAKDPKGNAIPLDAHIRLANPRTAATDTSRILRRGYNYDRGVDNVGNLDMGLVFCCYQQDVKRQFEATQTRLIDEPLVDYISPTGGGYFYALPGARNSSDWLGRTLLQA